jgi:hypothetical protein
LTPFEADDVIVTWNGPLVVEPVDIATAGLQSPGDMRLELVGAPVVMTIPDQAVMKAARVEYHAAQGLLRLVGSERDPLWVESSRLGILTGQSLHLLEAAGLVQVMGPGTLTTRGQREGEVIALAPDAATSSEDLAMAGNAMLTVSWKDRLDLLFSHDGGQARSHANPRRSSTKQSNRFDHGSARIRTVGDTPSAEPMSGPRGLDLSRWGRLEKARFTGQVALRHSRVNLDCEDLSLTMTDLPSRQGAVRRTIGGIAAMGNVRVDLRMDADPDPFLVRSSELTVSMQADAQGLAYPGRLLARGAVDARFKQQQLRADTVEISLLPRSQPSEAIDRPIGSAPSTATGSTPSDMAFAAANFTGVGRLALQRLTADGRVEIGLDNPEVRVEAERFVADSGGTQLEFFGTRDNPAKVSQPYGNIRGAYIVFQPETQTAQVAGAGTLMVYLKPDPAKNSDPDQSADLPLWVTWDRGMGFDNAQGLIQFSGNVQARADRGLETTQLSSDQLSMRMSGSSKGDRRPASSTETLGPLNYSGRVLQNLTAQGNVVFLYENWADQAGGTLKGRVRLMGPLVTLDQQGTQMQLVGPGTLLVEDYRRHLAGGVLQPPDASVKLAGLGATLFTWTDELLWDGLSRRVVLGNNVQMLHRPVDSSVPVQLDCRQLVAQFEGQGGLDQWLAGGLRPRVESVTADGGVRVLADQRDIRSDRLEYSVSNATVLLQAEQGRMTQVYEQNQPTPIAAEAFRWDLNNNRLEIIQPTRARVPLP